MAEKEQSKEKMIREVRQRILKGLEEADAEKIFKDTERILKSAEEQPTREELKQLFQQMVAEHAEKSKQQQIPQQKEQQQIPKKRYEWKIYRRR